MNSKLMFFSNLLKKPTEVAALVPSSKYVTNSVIKNFDFKNAKCIVEYGPGVGTITKEVLKHLAPDAKLICFELNLKFCKFLDKNLKDSRLIIVNDTAENLDFHMKKLKIGNIDYVFSGIPFSLIKKENKKFIIKKTRGSLRQGGRFIIYQYSRHVKKYLKIYFKKISTHLEVRNIPPNFVFVCEKT